MKQLLFTLLLTFFISGPVMAEKPAGVGNGKPTDMQKQHRQSTDDSYEKKIKTTETERTETKERKEAGKGSETGQKSREQHSKKWWKFWGE